ncbi:MAG: YqeG family HAD IIIA-type phosphatase [Anaerolineae bacterium]|nr:YqeG family HAD IIIA-type phosphatase [Anaerolineae bacterium]
MTSLLDQFTPDLVVRSVQEIPLQNLAAWGIRGLLFDLDNTLMEHHGERFDPFVTLWIKATLAQGFKVAIASNSPPERIVTLSAELGVPGIARSGKPRRGGLRQALAVLDLRPDEAAMVGDQIFTDVWAGRRLGLYTILVDRYARHEPWFIQAKRPLERAVLRRRRA